MDGKALYIPGNATMLRRVEDPHSIKAYQKYGTDCGVCGQKFNRYLAGNLVHHIDGNRTNHDIENLIVLCPTCHGKIHNRSRGRFVPTVPHCLDREQRLFELASRVRFRTKSLKGKGWSIERIVNLTDQAKQKHKQWLQDNAS